MKKLVLSLLAVLCGGVAATQAAEPATQSPAARNAALFASGETVQVNQIYFYSGRRYHHRHFVGYRTQRVVYRDGYGNRRVGFRRVAVYRYW